jgi:ADP-ribosylglycohydrolase
VVIIGDWTDDTDQMILILQSLLDHSGDVNYRDFAQKLHRWINEGFPELGDDAGAGCGRSTFAVITHPDYKTDPHSVKHRTIIFE